MPRHDDEAAARRYLLGLSSEAEADALEQAYLADAETLDWLRGVEDDLLDDEAAGRLGPEERGAFAQRYARSPVLRSRVAAARALGLARARVRSATTASSRRWLLPAAIAAGLIVPAVAAWLLSSRSPDAPPPSPMTTIVARSASPRAASPSPASARPEVTVALALSPVLLRGASAPPELRIPARATTVALELQGDAAVGPGGMQVSIHTVEGRAVWSGPAKGPGAAASPRAIGAVAVPASTLAPGDYLVTVSTAGARPRTLPRYYFRVLR